MGEEFDAALGEVRDLIDTAVSKYHEWALRSRLVVPVGPDANVVRQAIAQLIGSARHTIDVVIASETEQTVQLLAALRSLLEAEDSRVRARVVCTHAALEQDAFREFLDQGDKLQIRVARVPYLETVIVDGRMVLVRTEPGSHASLVQAQPLLEALHGLFLSAWRHGTVPCGRIDLGNADRTDLAAAILERLNAGGTDQAAARELGVSVRTYRRYVAGIMDALGTKSRFQAGVRAAEAGLLQPPHRRSVNEPQLLPSHRLAPTGGVELAAPHCPQSPSDTGLLQLAHRTAKDAVRRTVKGGARGGFNRLAPGAASCQ
ncbi:TrmB family transcriptional regulator sugar-binding domain-containing protein [Streptomyces albipurpureus]|uniref:Transcriptional regulator n=1 Tax=Streptomyces albipurpureus TaxID=2897419 RepID=A0ABT0UIC9_9ACTN|nr:TrmB family transcriptional regulator sugar-binding domain-containing protein [Streptomyces sp. CWNU-1]MCM2387921.1 transcriptional regulator [Streptomyces sp. CWNU-1]